MNLEIQIEKNNRRIAAAKESIAMGSINSELLKECNAMLEKKNEELREEIKRREKTSRKIK